MNSKVKTFIQVAKMAVHKTQKVTDVNVVKLNDLPGHMLYIYTDTILLKPNYKIVENTLLQIADKLKIEVSIQAPRCVGPTPMHKLNPLKRFLMIAIYEQQSVQQ